MTQKRHKTLIFYAFIAPWILVYLFFQVYPLLYGLNLSFTNYTGFNMHHLNYVGFRNYHNVFTDSDAIYALGRTLLVAVIYIPLSVLISLGLALLLNKKVRGLPFYRTLFYLPSIVPVLSTAIMWKYLYSGNGGILNNLFGLFGIPEVNWLDYDHITISLMIMLLWSSGGAGLLINLAGLKGIPSDLYESAEIDGATAFRRTLRITLPLMTPVIFFNVIIGIINALQIYAQPILLSGNELLTRPIQPNYLYFVHAFQQIFVFSRYSYGMALLWVLFLVIILLSIIVFRTSKYWVHYETDQGE